MVPHVDDSDENQTAARDSREPSRASAKRRSMPGCALESGDQYFAELAPGLRFAQRKLLIHFELDAGVVGVRVAATQIGREAVGVAAIGIIASHHEPRLGRLELTLPRFAELALERSPRIIEKSYIGAALMP